jgi:chaperonin cofactor prefoldin
MNPDQDSVKSEMVTEGKSVRPSSVEGLRINVLTAVGGMIVLASTFTTVGLYMSKLATLETRIDLIERGRSDDKNSIATLKQDLAILETRVRRAEDTQQSDAKKLDKIGSTVEAIGEMVLIMCQTSARPGVTCRLRP